MAHTLSAKKRVRQNEKRRLINKSYVTMMRNSTKKFLKAFDAKDLNSSEELYKNAIKTIDKIGSKGVIKKNQASRRVSRLTHKINQLRLEAK